MNLLTNETLLYCTGNPVQCSAVTYREGSPAKRVYMYMWVFLVAQLIENPPAMQGSPVQLLGQEDPLEKGSAIHSNILGLTWWLSQ